MLIRATMLLLVISAPMTLLLCGCASANRAKFQAVAVTAASREQALEAAKNALGRTYANVRANRRRTVVLADPLYVDFGETELEAVATALEKPDEVLQAFGRVRRTPAIRIKKRDDLFTFEVRVQRELEELEAGYVAYDTPYDLHEASSMPTDPSAYGGFKAPPRAEWIPQGNDAIYEAQLRRALADELAR